MSRMKDRSFNIFRAVRDAYLFVGREWRYLLRLAGFPVAAGIATLLVAQLAMPGGSILADALWNIPANAVMGWYLFLQTRLLVFGERLDRLPPGGAQRASRRRALVASVCVWVLFNMGLAALAQYFEWTAERYTPGTPMTAAGIAGLLLVGFSVWAVRLGVAHILAAAGYSIKAFLIEVNGVMFSVRLIGMAMLCVLPLLFPLQIVMAAVLSGKSGIGVQDLLMLAALGAPFSCLAGSLCNAAAVFALKEALGRRA